MSRRRSDGGPRVGLFGILCSGNLGNDGSLDAVVNFLKDKHPDARLGFFCMGPELATQRYGAPAESLQWYEAHAASATGARSVLLKIYGKLLDPFRTLAWVRHYDLVIVPGMGALETTTPVRPWAFPFSLWILCVGARLFGGRVALVNVGANVMRQRATRWLFASAGRMAHYRSYRDDFSRDAMRQIGVDVSSDEVFPDVAFALAVPLAPTRPTGTVGVGLMAFTGGNDDRHRADALYAGYLDTMKRFVRGLLDDGRRVRLFTGDPEDADTLRAVLADATAYRPGMVVAEDADTLDDLMRQMAGVDAVVATRYHNVLCALKLSKPTLSIGYAAKHTELMAGMGLAEFNLPAHSIGIETLTARFAELERRSGELSEQMTVWNRRYAARLDEQFATLSAKLFPAGKPSGRSRRT